MDRDRLALDVDDYDMVMRDVGLSGIALTPAPGVPFEDIDRAVKAEIERIQTGGISQQELQKAINQELVGTVSDLSTNSGRVNSIGDGALFYDDPRRALTELQRLQSVTTEDVRRVARTYLNDTRGVLRIVPGGEQSQENRLTEQRAGSHASESAEDKKTYPEPPAGASPRPVQFPPVQRFTLDNGMDVFLVEDHDVPLTSAWLVFDAGEIYDPVLADLTATMLMEGTTTRSKQELLSGLENLGGSLDADIGTHTAAASVDVLRRDLPKALDLLADAARNPAFPEEALERLKEVTKASISAGKARASTLANKLLDRALYPPGHPYAYPFPNDADIDNVSQEDLKRFYKRMYQPANGYLMLAGDIRPAEARRLAEAAFGDWKAGDEPLPDPLDAYKDLEPWPQTVVHVVDRPGSAQARILVGNIALPRNAPDWIPMELATAILGGNSTGRLFRDLREVQGLAYAISASVESKRAPGLFRVSTGTRPENVAAMLGGILQHVHTMREALPDKQEYADRIQQTVGRFPLQMQTAQQVAYRVNTLKAYRLPWDYYSHYRDQVRQTSAEQIRDAARAHMSEHPTVVIVGPADTVIRQVREVLPEAQIQRYDINLSPLGKS